MPRTWVEPGRETVTIPGFFSRLRAYPVTILSSTPKAMLTKNALLTGAGLGLAALAGADFTLTAPAAIETKGNGTIPCGDYDALDREKETDWPVLGHDVGVNTNDPWSTFTFRAALADDLTKFVTLRPAVHHGRAGDFCFMRIRGVKDWVGKKAVVEVRQYTGGGEYDYGVSPAHPFRSRHPSTVPLVEQIRRREGSPSPF